MEIRFTLMFAVAIAFAQPAFARDVTASELLADKSDALPYTFGAMQAFIAASAYNLKFKHEADFCLPPQMQISGPWALELLRQAVVTHPEYGKMAASVILMGELREQFPCK
jgi:hypothetical protein